MICLLGEIQTKLRSERVRGNTNPAVVTITLQDIEPEPGHTPVRQEQILELINKIADDGGKITLIGPEQDVKGKLESPTVQICYIDQLSECVRKSLEYRT